MSRSRDLPSRSSVWAKWLLPRTARPVSRFQRSRRATRAERSSSSFEFHSHSAARPRPKDQRPEDTDMRSFHVQGIEVRARRSRVFEFVKDPANLPQWTHAFESVANGRARLETPTGTVDVGL